MAMGPHREQLELPEIWPAQYAIAAVGGILRTFKAGRVAQIGPGLSQGGGFAIYTVH